MYLNFICQVDRLISNTSGGRSYGLSTANFDHISSWEDEQEWGRQLSQARHQVQILSYPKSQDCIANLRDDVEDLEAKGLFNPQTGGVKLWLPDGPTGNFFVTLMGGTDGLGEISTLAEMGLQSQHLFLQFSVDVDFSKFAENPNLVRPVTFEMFCDGTRMYLPGLPEIQLVRRAIP